jgi:hypothetical protein
MQNTLISTAALLFTLIAVLGCGVSERVQKEIGGTNHSNSNVNANKTITDRAIESAAGEGKLGIPECDEAIDILAAQANNPDDNFVVKAAKTTALTKFREQVKKGLENKKANRADTAKFCGDFKASLDDSAREPDANQQ